MKTQNNQQPRVVTNTKSNLFAYVFCFALAVFSHYNRALAQANVQFPTQAEQTLKSDAPSGDWVPVDNLFNDGDNVILQDPGSATPTAPFNTDYRLLIEGDRVMQYSQGTAGGTGNGDMWSMFGKQLNFGSFNPGLNYTGLTNEWDEYSSVFGLSDDPHSEPVKHGLIQWQDWGSADYVSRLRFVYRDGQAAPGWGEEIGSVLPSGKWGFGLDNITPLSTVDVYGGLYVGSYASVSAGYGDGYFTNSLRVGGDGFMSGASGFAGLVIDEGKRIGIGTNNPVVDLDIWNKDNGNTGTIKLRNATSTNGTEIFQALGNLGIWNLDAGDIVVAATSGYINLAAGAVLMNWSGAVSPGGYTLYVNGGAYKTVGGADWNTLSDKRFKKDIRDYEDGLGLIKKIEPKRFRYNGKLNTNPDNLEIGVIAQDLQVIAPYMVQEAYDSTEGSFLTMNNGAMTYALINAVKELDAENKFLNEQLNEQKKEIESIRQLLLEQGKSNNNENVPQLYQNAPNPFNGETQIQYYLPQSIKNAEIVISNTQNETVRSFTNLQSGKGTVIFTSPTPKEGISFYYSLIVNGEKVATLKMLTK